MLTFVGGYVAGMIVTALTIMFFMGAREVPHAFGGHLASGATGEPSRARAVTNPLARRLQREAAERRASKAPVEF